VLLQNKIKISIRKIIYALLLLTALPIAASAQLTTDKTFTVYKLQPDTVRCVLHITNSKLNKLQAVPGYVIMSSSGRKLGYLSRLRKPLPKKVEVWYHSL
jgi:hypothetical protein